MVVHTDAALRAIFGSTRTIAVLGAKEGSFEPAFYVPEYLRRHGWSVTGVNPKLAGRRWLDQPAVGTLAELPAPHDLIEVFRRTEFLLGHAREILALPWRPRVVWFQLGIRDDAAAALLGAEGIDVVQDRCMMPEHERLFG